MTAASGSPPPSDLPGDEQVRLGAVVLDRPDRAGAADSRLHLVVDVERSVLAAELEQPGGEVLGQRDEPAFALHGLDDDAPDLVLGEERRDVLERVVRGHAAVRIRPAGAVHLGGERTEPFLVDLLVRHRHRQQRAAVERVFEDDDSGLPGRGAGDLDGVLDRLGTAVQEQALLIVAGARRQPGEPAADFDVRLVDPDHEALVEVRVDLLVHGRDRSGQAVARVLAAEPAGKIDVRLAVDVLDAGAFGPGDDDRRRRDPARHVLLAGGQDALALGPLLHRHETILT